MQDGVIDEVLNISKRLGCRPRVELLDKECNC